MYYHNGVDNMTTFYANVGKHRNLAQSLLLYTKSICFYRKFASRFLHKSPNAKQIPQTRVSAISANFCKFTENPGGPASLISCLQSVICRLFFILRTGSCIFHFHFREFRAFQMACFVLYTLGSITDSLKKEVPEGNLCNVFGVERREEGIHCYGS